jgi:hypothetical protein
MQKAEGSPTERTTEEDSSKTEILTELSKLSITQYAQLRI